jgi:hypothetical protein
MYNISRSCVDVLIFYVILFGVVYLAWCDFTMDWTVSVHQMLCKSFLSSRETLAMIRQIYGEERMSSIQVFECKRPNRMRLKKVSQVKSKIKSMLIIFFGTKGIIHKEFILAGQTANSEYCCEVLSQLRKNAQMLRP